MTEFLLFSGSVRDSGVFRFKCSGKSNSVGTGFALVGPRPPSKCLEQILVCLVTFKLCRRHSAIHFCLLSFSDIPETYWLTAWPDCRAEMDET